ncbi:MAG: ion transporter [Balneola sp.]|nr:ion transporter [Balneola sp.]|tara:strand:+ start:318 stop:1139 length:822 start_codon:yes stop_codon:yes gene_type:complete
MQVDLVNIPPKKGFRRNLHIIIFGSDTFSGKLFDIILIAAIVLSVAVIMMDSISEIRVRYGDLLWNLEWAFTLLFSVEYLFRIATVKNVKDYVLSFYGIIDFLAVLPTYLSILIPGTQYLVAIRVLRILRIFRVLKLALYLSEVNFISKALWQSRRKILVFLFAVVLICMIAGSIMYVVEGPEYGFSNIPISIYWAIVTLSTVGFGDIAPVTPLGQFISAIIMMLGYGIIAVPTGIVTYEMTKNTRKMHHCSVCGKQDHERDALFCKYCGEEL